MEEKDIVLFNEYSLNLQTCCRVAGVLTEPPQINEFVEYTETTKGKLPEYISEEIFDKLVETLKQGLIDKGILLKTPVNPCHNCGVGYEGWGMDKDGSYFIQDCHDNCQKLKDYYKLIEKRKELLED